MVANKGVFMENKKNQWMRKFNIYIGEEFVKNYNENHCLVTFKNFKILIEKKWVYLIPNDKHQAAIGLLDGWEYLCFDKERKALKLKGYEVLQKFQKGD